VQTGQQRSRGAEADLIWEPSPAVSVLASYAWTDATVREDSNTSLIGDRLPRVPEHSGRVAIRYRVLSGALKGLGLGVGVTAASAAEITLPNSDRGDSFGVFDAQASYDFGRFRVGVTAANLFDHRYFLPYQYLGQAVLRPGQPRSAFVTLGAHF
jgi:iron complex outermembrane receptor protein